MSSAEESSESFINVGKPEEPFQMSSTCYAPRIFHKLIKNNALLKDIPCKLIFPSRKFPQNIKIFARTQEVIDEAKECIENIIAKQRAVMRPNHFICLPIQDSASVASFKLFKQKVLEEANENPLYRDIDGDLFIRENRLHFTLATLLLIDEKEIEDASRLITTFNESEIWKSISSAPLQITIRGLKTMQKEPKYSNVLYATVCLAYAFFYY